jgi:catechol 2,3-dioxygenase-like lactoylglutathione lyase family enzyme
MKYLSALVAVADVAVARSFYEGLLGLEVDMDFGVNVSFKGGLAIHQLEHFRGLIEGREVRQRSHDGELYFEHDDVAGAEAAFERSGAAFLHRLREQPWRQLVFRAYDPDGHIVEVGESMEALCARLAGEGLDTAGICAATGLPAAFVEEKLGKR